MKKNLLFSVLSLIFLWVVWIIAYFIVGNDYVLPSFTDTFVSVGEFFISGTFWTAFGKTFLRTFLAFLFSVCFGIGLALLSFLWKWTRAFLAPVISVLRTVPTMAVILLLLLWTSPSVAPVIVSSLVLFPAVYAAAIASLDEVDAEYGELVRAFRVKGKRKIMQLYLPLTAPPLMKQFGAIFSMGLKITVSGEVLASTYQSIGGMMQSAKMFVQLPELIALTILTVLLGFFIEGICMIAYRFSARWRG